MRRIQKEYILYKFDELSKDVQERVLEKYIDIEYQHYLEYCLYDDMENLARDLLQTYFKGANYTNIYYDLSYSQGSGSMIAFNIDLEDLNNKYNKLSKEQIKELESFGGTDIKVYHNDSHYYHEYTFAIDYNNFTMYGYEWETFENEDEIEDKIDEMIKQFKKDIVNMNKELSNSGYNQLENKEYFEELARINILDLEFLENGDVFYE